ncbi:hypothetical protein EDEG_01338 [Edhazardia aedis USNM 41457]|uniref:Uncharacterized protein n=1 Tax=Edhazardia aedis (strain USNM 41457) TaxID=1003232 RepID=J8ZXQ0_EDHAE|nr:hypothetical protein EDEG_01338 [Edhazardia aedis USNM 41457]|eukprot:EJW04468.1 hypothetical protein EDEG_01338 [Edhazardia aedis USNM 41457]
MGLPFNIKSKKYRKCILYQSNDMKLYSVSNFNSYHINLLDLKQERPNSFNWPYINKNTTTTTKLMKSAIVLLSSVLVIKANYPHFNRLITRSFTVTAPSVNPFENIEMRRIVPHIVIGPIRLPTRNMNFENQPNFPVHENNFSSFNREDSNNESSEVENNEETPDKEIKRERKLSLWRRFINSLSGLATGEGLIKVAVIVLILFISVGVGYQIRKSEETSKYVRLPNSN